MKASPLLLIVCLGVAPAQAGSSFGGPHIASGAQHAHSGGPNGRLKNFVNAVSDIEPGPAPSLPLDAPPEPESFAPPLEPAFFSAPYVFEPAVAPRARPGPHILYLREPTKRRAGPVVIYGAG